ncbi:FHA domain-containing protein [Cryobacterium breve]|uniref:FHA domain-containing protein n=2 Tax=Microbacteriaceae TaxID=85023 RepID=A0ABY2IV22_9MICO|nr:FHA domain-containing protein [Cryobacterium sp. TmT3-12]TFC95463.1 FHA domain-containing protein [Cryobacterium breve]
MAPGHVDDATIIHVESDRSPADADTVLGRPARAALGATAAHPVRPAEARLRFRLPNGEEILLDQPHQLGRRPRPPRIASGSPARLIQVTSPTSAVSGTHLEIRQEGSSVVVTDLGSTNGTIVIPPRGRRQRLHSGQSLTVLPGTTVDIGDGNIIEILPAAGTTPAQ